MNDTMQALSKSDRVSLQHQYEGTREIMHKINALLAAGIEQAGHSPLKYKGKCVQEFELTGSRVAGSIIGYMNAEQINGSRICSAIDIDKITEVHDVIAALFVNGRWNGNHPVLYGCDVDCTWIKQRSDEMQPQKNALRVESMSCAYDLFCGARLKPGRIGGHYDDYLPCCVSGYKYAAFRQEVIGSSG